MVVFIRTGQSWRVEQQPYDSQTLNYLFPGSLGENFANSWDELTLRKKDFSVPSRLRSKPLWIGMGGQETVVMWGLNLGKASCAPLLGQLRLSSCTHREDADWRKQRQSWFCPHLTLLAPGTRPVWKQMINIMGLCPWMQHLDTCDGRLPTRMDHKTKCWVETLEI